MTEKAIRRWAWKKSKERRWFLMAVLLVCLAPGMAVSRWGQGLSWPLRVGVAWPLSFLVQMMVLGSTLVFLHVAQGEETSLKDIFTPFSREWLRKAFVVTLIYLCVTSVVSGGTDLLRAQGQQIINGSGYLEAVNSRGSNGIYEIGITREMMLSNLAGSAIKSMGSWLGTIVSLFFGVLWFPVNYLLFLAPEKTGREVIREGTSLGFHSFWKIVKFEFLTMFLPFLGLFLIAFLISLILMPLLEMVWPGIVLGIILLFAFLSLMIYGMTACAKFAIDLLGKTKGGKGKKKRK